MENITDSTSVAIVEMLATINRLAHRDPPCEPFVYFLLGALTAHVHKFQFRDPSDQTEDLAKVIIGSINLFLPKQ